MTQAVGIGVTGHSKRLKILRAQSGHGGMPLPRRLSGSRSICYWVIVSDGVCGGSVFSTIGPPGRRGGECVFVCEEAKGHNQQEGISCCAASLGLQAVEAKCPHPSSFPRRGCHMVITGLYWCSRCIFDSRNHLHASLTCGKALSEAVM